MINAFKCVFGYPVFVIPDFFTEDDKKKLHAHLRHSGIEDYAKDYPFCFGIIKGFDILDGELAVGVMLSDGRVYLTTNDEQLIHIRNR